MTSSHVHTHHIRNSSMDSTTMARGSLTFIYHVPIASAMRYNNNNNWSTDDSNSPTPMARTSPQASWKKQRWIPVGHNGWLPAPSHLQPKSEPHAQLIDAIAEHRKSSFINWSLEVTVVPTRGSEYEFSNFGDDYRIRTHCRFEGNAISVWRHSKWLPLNDFLDEEAARCPTNPNRLTHLSPFDAYKARIRHQGDWWVGNGKHFRLLDLPKELREMVYEHCMPRQAMEPYPHDRLRRKSRYIDRVPYHNQINTNMLHCGNRMICHEMRDHMFRELPLLITHSHLINKTFAHNSFFPRGRLTYLTLAFSSHVDLLQFFGFKARDPFTGDEFIEWASTAARMLRRDNLPSLKKLEIGFPSRDTLSQHSTLAEGCQTTTVEMELQCMWPYIEHQPLVFTGMIKHSQKQRWEQKARNSVLKWEEEMAGPEGGVPVTEEDLYDQELWEEVLKEWREENGFVEESDSEVGSENDGDSDEGDSRFGDQDVMSVTLPFECHCDPPCLEGEWTAEDVPEDV